MHPGQDADAVWVTVWVQGRIVEMGSGFFPSIKSLLNFSNTECSIGMELCGMEPAKHRPEENAQITMISNFFIKIVFVFVFVFDFLLHKYIAGYFQILEIL